MQSAIFNSTIPLNSQSSFPSTITNWDNALLYNTYNFKLLADSDCVVNVYQSTPPSLSAINGDLAFCTTTTTHYINKNMPKTITNNISAKYIAFLVTNISGYNQSVFDFSVIYK